MYIALVCLWCQIRKTEKMIERITDQIFDLRISVDGLDWRIRKLKEREGENQNGL